MTKVFHFLMVLKLVTSAFCDEEVLEFSDNDFKIRIAEYPTALVLFYAPWCSYCNRLKPDFARAAKNLTRNDPPVDLIQMDCTETSVQTCKEYSISSYPTLKIFHYGIYSKNYDGIRDTQEIVKYMRGEARPVLKEIKSVIGLEQLLNTIKESVVIGFFKAKSALNVAFMETVKNHKIKCQFAVSSDEKVLDQLGVSNGVLLFRPLNLKNKFEPVSVAYSGTANVSELNDFIIKNFHGLVGVRKLENQDHFHFPLIVVYFAVDYEKNSKRSNYWRNRVLIVAKEFEGKVTFAISSSDTFAEELGKVGVEEIKFDKPIAVAIDSGGNKSLLRDEFSVEALKSFTMKFLMGQLEIFVKSEPVPEAQDGSVTTAVAKNFKDVVLNNGKDTLIEFYAPGCGECKKLAPIYEELAKTLDKEDIAIVKINAVANDIPSPYKVDGYPTVYWAPKDRKDSPIVYEGEGSVPGFIKFIAQKATDELKGWDRNGNSKDVKFEF